MNLFRLSSFLISLSLILCSASSAKLAYASDGEAEVAAEIPLSPATKTCIGCHSNVTPGIVKDWLTSRHSKIVASAALKKPLLERRVSADSLPKDLAGYAVGCYECHSMNNSAHKDSFDHMGRNIHVVVTPEDCKTCHPVEAAQFSGSKKSFARKILMDNPVFKTLVDAAVGPRKFESEKLVAHAPSESTLHETCLGCHGTKVEAKGMRTIATRIGEIQVPELTNWPNQGVGRVNPDGSRGACSACHPRHGFLIEVARKPYTCSQCHHEPDVPAWDVYEESKHGNIYFSKNAAWDFSVVPWQLGKDFKAPTCAVCHNSLLVSPAGDVIAERSHDFGSRLWVRLFGLIYSHPQPKSGDTTIIRNKDGLPLPTAFSGELAAEYLIDKTEQEKRASKLRAVCNGCHNKDWIDGHFSKLSVTMKETDAMILTSTKLMSDAWDRGIEDKKNPFDESIEKMWTKQWLFYCNSIRYASAMTGAPDYTSFKNGWWSLNENLRQMEDWIELKKKMKDKD